MQLELSWPKPAPFTWRRATVIGAVGAVLAVGGYAAIALVGSGVPRVEPALAIAVLWFGGSGLRAASVLGEDDTTVAVVARGLLFALITAVGLGGVTAAHWLATVP